MKDKIVSIFSFPLKLIFYYPGRLILWYRYFYPTKDKQGGFIGVAKGRRQYKEGGKVVTAIASCGFWWSVILILSLLADWEVI